MGSDKDLNLVDLLEKLVTDLLPYAKRQKVELRFFFEYNLTLPSSARDVVYVQYSNLIRRIISYTPESNSVTVTIKEYNPKKNATSIHIEITGADLTRIWEIKSSFSFDCEIQSTEKGTLFSTKLPNRINDTNILDLSHHTASLGFTPYYIEINDRLKKYFNNTNAQGKNEEPETIFLKQVNQAIQLKIDDSDFKVQDLADELALSRSHLFRKLKELTQMSPNQYLLVYRLFKAKELIEKGFKDINISEVCYGVGFVSKSHFSRTFRNQFGVSPSTYRKNLMQHTGN